MSDPRLHHFLTRAYLARFARADGLVYRWDRGSGEVKSLHPSVIGAARDLYTVVDSDGRKIFEVEKILAKHIDGPFALAIGRLKPGVWPEPVDVSAIANFIALQIARSPRSLAEIEKGARDLFVAEAKLSFATKERAISTVDQHLRETGEDLGDPDELFEYMQGDDFDVEISRSYSVNLMLGATARLAPVLRELEWTFLGVPKGRAFVTADNLPCIVPPQNQSHNAVGLCTPGAVKYFPLTSRICLRMGEPGYDPRWRTLSPAVLRIVNTNLAASCDRYVYGSDRRVVERAAVASGAAERTGCLTEQLIELDGIDGVASRFSNFTYSRFYHPEM